MSKLCHRGMRDRPWNVSHCFEVVMEGIYPDQFFKIQMSKEVCCVRLQMRPQCLFWCVVTLEGWCLTLHICEWAKWFVWDRSRGRGREPRSGRGGGYATTSCRTQSESHLYYVMTAGALHPLLSFSQFPRVSPSQTPPPKVDLAFALLLCVFLV